MRLCISYDVDMRDGNVMKSMQSIDDKGIVNSIAHGLPEIHTSIAHNEEQYFQGLLFIKIQL